MPKRRVTIRHDIILDVTCPRQTLKLNPWQPPNKQNSRSHGTVGGGDHTQTEVRPGFFSCRHQIIATDIWVFPSYDWLTNITSTGRLFLFPFVFFFIIHWIVLIYNNHFGNMRWSFWKYKLSFSVKFSNVHWTCFKYTSNILNTRWTFHWHMKNDEILSNTGGAFS